MHCVIFTIQIWVCVIFSLTFCGNSPMWQKTCHCGFTIVAVRLSKFGLDKRVELKVQGLANLSWTPSFIFFQLFLCSSDRIIWTRLIFRLNLTKHLVMEVNGAAGLLHSAIFSANSNSWTQLRIHHASHFFFFLLLKNTLSLHIPIIIIIIIAVCIFR